VWKQNRNNAKNKNILNSLATVNYKNEGNATGNSEKVAHPAVSFSLQSLPSVKI